MGATAIPTKNTISLQSKSDAQVSLPNSQSISFSESCFEVESNYCPQWNGTKIQQMEIGSYSINSNIELANYLNLFNTSSCQPYFNYYVCNLISQNSNCGTRLCDSSCNVINQKLMDCNTDFQYYIDYCAKDDCLPKSLFIEKSSPQLNNWVILIIVICCSIPLLCLMFGCLRRRHQKSRKYENLKSEFVSPQSSRLVLRNVASTNSLTNNSLTKSLAKKFSKASFIPSSKNSSKSNSRTPSADLYHPSKESVVQTAMNNKFGLPTPYKPSMLNMDMNDKDLHVLLNEIPIPARASIQTASAFTTPDGSPATPDMAWSEVTDYNELPKARESLDSAIAVTPSGSHIGNSSVSIQTDKSYLVDTRGFNKNVEIVENLESEMQTEASFIQKTNNFFLRGKQSLKVLISGSNLNSFSIAENSNTSAERVNTHNLSNKSSLFGGFMEPLDSSTLNRNISEKDLMYDQDSFSSAIQLIDKYKTGKVHSPIEPNPVK